MLRRAAATKTSVGKTLFVLNWFVGSIRIEKIHPLEAGFVRLKFRRDRRSGFPIEPALTFYPRFIAETIAKQVRWAWLWGRTRRLYKSIRFGKGRYEYMDESLTPVLDDEVETHAMFDTAEAKAFVAQQKRIAAAAGRRRPHRARQRRAAHLPLLHHRRQLRPQQGLGADLRPA